MKRLELEDSVLSVDFAKAHINSLIIRGKERVTSIVPLFAVCLRDKEGKTVRVSAFDAKNCTETNDGAFYSDFANADITVKVSLTDEKGEIRTYRVDRMKDVRFTGIPREGEEVFKEIDLKSYTQRVFSMYGGEEKNYIKIYKPSTGYGY